MAAADSFGEAREAMVARLAETGASERALAAVAAVPREKFVAWFFSYPPSVRFGRPGDVREWRVDGPEVEPDAVALVYDQQRALGIATDASGRTTSTVSAPNLLVSMLDLLDLEPGMTVLEIGAGSGYTAALIGEMVGDPSLVTTVDIDERLVETARANLDATGYGRIRVLAADGDEGVPGARFDRIVATVGCEDISPAWLTQLAPDGLALIPVHHGGVHPLMRVATEPGAVTGAVVGRSAFVFAQGSQAGHSPWPRVGRLGPREHVGRRPLPEQALARLRPSRERARIGAVGLWDFGYHLALCDRRTTHLASLVDSGARSAANPRPFRAGFPRPERRKPARFSAPPVPRRNSASGAAKTCAVRTPPGNQPGTRVQASRSGLASSSHRPPRWRARNRSAFP